MSSRFFYSRDAIILQVAGLSGSGSYIDVRTFLASTFSSAGGDYYASSTQPAFDRWMLSPKFACVGQPTLERIRYGFPTQKELFATSGSRGISDVPSGKFALRLRGVFCSMNAPDDCGRAVHVSVCEGYELKLQL